MHSVFMVSNVHFESIINLSAWVRTIKNKSNESVRFIYHFCGIHKSTHLTFFFLLSSSQNFILRTQIINKCGECNEISINAGIICVINCIEERMRWTLKKNLDNFIRMLCALLKSKRSPVWSYWGTKRATQIVEKKSRINTKRFFKKKWLGLTHVKILYWNLLHVKVDQAKAQYTFNKFQCVFVCIESRGDENTYNQ